MTVAELLQAQAAFTALHGTRAKRITVNTDPREFLAGNFIKDIREKQASGSTTQFAIVGAERIEYVPGQKEAILCHLE